MGPYAPQVPSTPGNRKARKTKSRPNRPDKDTVGVYLRLRPLKLEEPTILKVDDTQVRTYPPDGSNEQIYSFTQVFDNARQSEIFNKVARPVVEDFIVSGKDGLIFTYGITGSGKTYTMEGLPSDPGLIYRTIDFLFNSIGAHQTPENLIQKDQDNTYRLASKKPLYPNLSCPGTVSAMPSVVRWQNRVKETAYVSVNHDPYYCLFISLIELYNKQVHDLFEDFDNNTCEKDRKRREIRTDERGMSYVANAVEIEVKSADEAVEYYTRGIKRRKTGSTALNQESSRGHCVLNLKLVQVRKLCNDNKSYEFDEDTLISSQLCLVDLAGSERTKRSGATGGALHEAGNINNSLGALRKCIRALRDCEPNSNIQYREYSLTRLFKSYFEGHGTVNMVLCVKPTTEDFHENNLAMDFGLLTQDVAVDYATPPKLMKRSKGRIQDNYAIMYEYFDKRMSHYEPNPDLSDEQFIEGWIDRLKSNRDKRKKYVETALGAQNEVRQNILTTMEENKSLRQEYETRSRELRSRDEKLELLESQLNSTERSKENKIKHLERQVRDLEGKHRRAKDLSHQFELRYAQNEKLYLDVLNLLKTEQNRSDALRRVMQLLKKMKPEEWASVKPSAPEMEPLQSSSPMGAPVPSTTETTESRSPPTTSDNSMEAPELQSVPRSPSKILQISPSKGGIPIVNPRHNRSLSCSNMQWIHHKPPGTIDTGTVMKPKLKNGRSVKNLSINDILRKDAGGYSVVHQNADSEGEVETFVYKGQIVSTACGGAQVTFNDVETMKQVSPKRRRRAASDAHYTR